MARHEVSREYTPQGRVALLRCEYEDCGRVWWRPERPGPRPRWCSDACKQADYRRRQSLSDAARRAYLARQEQRRRAWRSHEATAWLLADQERRHRAEEAGDRVGVGVRAEEDDLDDARAIVFLLAGVDEGDVAFSDAFVLATQRTADSPAVVRSRLLEAKLLLQAAGRWN